MNKPSSSSVLESLESRLAPAGIVMLNLAGGALTVTGDADGNHVQISETSPGLWNVSDGAGSGTLFSLNGGAAVTSVDFAAANKITANLHGGDDTLSLLNTQVAGGVKLDAGDGADVFQTDGVTIGKNLSVNLGAGDDTVDISNGLTVGGRLGLDLGEGNNNVNSWMMTDLTAGSLAVKAGSGWDTVNIEGNHVSIGGNAVFQLGGGENQAYLRQQESLAITGRVTYQGGTGNDALTLDAPDLSILGAVRFIGGQGDSSFRLSSANGTVGSVSVTAEGGSHVTIGDSFIGGDNITVQGDVTSRLGTGDTHVEISNTTILGHLTTTNRSDIGDSLSLKASTVHGSVVARSLGSADSGVVIDDSTFHGDVLVNTGAGNDSVLLETGGDGFFVKNNFQGILKVNLGDGDDLFEAGVNPSDGDAGNHFENLILNGGAGTDTARFLTGYGNTFGTAPVVTNVETLS